MSLQLPCELGQFGTGVELSIGHIGTGIKCPDTSKCLESEMSLAPKYLVTAEFQEKMSNIRY